MRPMDANSGEIPHLELDLHVLQAATRKQLQAIAKKHSVRANMKTADLIEALTALQQQDGTRRAS